jgi:hypothetical protein
VVTTVTIAISETKVSTAMNIAAVGQADALERQSEKNACENCF